MDVRTMPGVEDRPVRVPPSSVSRDQALRGSRPQNRILHAGCADGVIDRQRVEGDLAVLRRTSSSHPLEQLWRDDEANACAHGRFPPRLLAAIGMAVMRG